MYALSISLLVFVLMCAGAFAGVKVRPLLLESHVHPDSREVVKMATGLVGTLAALVLGLLISSAKSSFDQKTGQAVNRPFNCGLMSILFLKPFGKTVALAPSERVGLRRRGERDW